MKHHNGFISNSSSTSFIVIISEEKYNEFYKTLDPLQRDFLDATEYYKFQLNGKNYLHMSGAPSWHVKYEDYNRLPGKILKNTEYVSFCEVLSSIQFPEEDCHVHEEEC